MKWIINISGPSKLPLEEQEVEVGEALSGGVGKMDEFVGSQSPLAEAVMQFLESTGRRITGSGVGMGRWDLDVYAESDEEMLNLIKALDDRFKLQRKKAMIWWHCRDREV